MLAGPGMIPAVITPAYRTRLNHGVILLRRPIGHVLYAGVIPAGIEKRSGYKQEKV